MQSYCNTNCLHCPKNPACPICNRSRMHRKKVRRFRQDPLEDRGALDPTTQFGLRIAADFIIVQKLSSGKEHRVQVIRDEYSGRVRAYPMFKRDAAYDNPFVMIKSDQAAETKLACKQLACEFEGSLENRLLHNAALELDIRTLQEVTHACHLQAGFDIVPGLWIHSVEFAATMLNAKHIASGNTETRHKLATGSEFNGRELLLGQLVHYRVDPLQRGKFDASSKPGLFCGWRYDSGPRPFKNVLRFG